MTSTPSGPLHALLLRIDDAVRRLAERAAPRGLLDGQGGVALFHAYHYRLTGDDAQLERLHQGLAQLVDALAHERPGPSLCSGLAGIAWCIQHLIDEGFVDAPSADHVLGGVDAALADAMVAALADQRHDLLHEGLGIAVYFLARLPDPAARAHLERAVAQLAATAARAGDAIRWQDHFTRSDGAHAAPTYNLGLAHGTPAIIAVLAGCHARGVATAHTAPLLRGATRWLRAARNPPGATSRYPIRVDADHRPVGPATSRLGWCYGDLAVATALHHAGAALADRDVLAEAHATFAQVARTRGAADGAIADASLCHGSMGVSHLLRRAARATGDDELAAAADRWLAHTLALTASPTGLRVRRGDRDVDVHDLLSGAAGVGLGVLAALDPDTAPDWDRCLLLV